MIIVMVLHIMHTTAGWLELSCGQPHMRPALLYLVSLV